MTTARQTPRFARKRELILEAAAALFNARGLGGVTLADVAQSVGLTTTSVTYYYRRKEDLAAACLMRTIGTMDGLVDRAWAEAAPTPPARLTRFLRLYFDLLADMVEGRAAAGINFWDLRALGGPGAEVATTAFVAVFRRLRELFRDPAGPGFARAEQNARTHLVFSAAIRAKGWAARYEPEDYSRAAERTAAVLIDGLAGSGRLWNPPGSDIGEARGAEAGAREAFLRAATELLNAHGYRGASVDRISARLNVTKGSFYHHNETKDDLVTACFERTFDTYRRAHRAALTVAPDGWSRVCAMSAALVRHQLSPEGPLLRISALSATGEPRRPELLAAFERLSEKTAGVIADGVAAGSIRAVDPVIAAEVVTGAINAAAELARWAPAATEANAAELFVRPLVLGVFSPPASRSPGGAPMSPSVVFSGASRALRS